MSFEEFWAEFLEEHSHPLNRILHALAAVIASSGTAVALFKRNPRWWVAGLLAAYGVSWFGHFAFQKKVVPTFWHPVWRIRADLRMLGRMAASWFRGEAGSGF